MAKIKFTKNELKKQRDSLHQFLRYLPTLQLKKQQLQMRILQTRKTLEDKLGQIEDLENKIGKWVGFLEELNLDLEKWVTPLKIVTDNVNIAGANIPVFKDAVFHGIDYDFYAVPLWVDKALEDLRALFFFMAEAMVLRRQILILEKELRTTAQRVNLFEKVKIPECLDHIRVIRIYLGDQQANAVGISKVAKQKIAQNIPEEVPA